MSTQRFALGLALAALVAAVLTISLRAADKESDAKTDKAKAQDKDTAKGKEDEVADRYQLPEGGVKELLAFLKEVMGQSRPKTQQEFAKRQAAMRAAAEKIKEIATEDDQKLEGFDDAIGLVLYFKAMDARRGSASDTQKLLEEIKSSLKSPTISKYAAFAAQIVADSLERNPEMAITVNKELGSILSKNPDKQIARVGATMEGTARRLDLVGKPMNVSGTLMDGTKFDWAKYRGKVVLVDFWATWCGPCRAELPNVKRNYEKYHDLGFDVVGISLDGDREALEKFLETEKNPWVTVHDGDWNDNELATYYGVTGIPTVILVDKEGKVVSTDARGEELSKQLADLLGPVEDDNKPAAGEEK